MNFMVNNSVANLGGQGGVSNQFILLKKRVVSQVDSGSEIGEDLFLECQKFIRSIIIEGLEDSFFHEYCAYAQSLGIRFVRDDFMMSVSMESNKTNLNIDPILCMLYLNREEEVLYVIAHEAKHCLHKHLVKYYNMFKDDVQATFMNIATDVEIDESLNSELRQWGKHYMPKGNLTWLSVNRILGYDAHERYILSRSSSVVNFIYSSFNVKCKEVLGGTFLQLYRKSLLLKVSFTREIFKVAAGNSSPLFDIPYVYKEEAKRFCNELTGFLKYPTSVIYIKETNDLSGFSTEGTLSSSMGDGLDDNITSSKDMTKEVTDCPQDDNVKDIGKITPTVRGMSIGEVDMTLDEVEEGFQELSSNLNFGLKFRSSGGHGRGRVDYKETEHKMPWQSALKRYMLTYSSKHETSKRRLNRRQPERLELSGVKPKNDLYLVVGVDESGSISSLEYNYFLTELKQIIRLYNCPIHVIEFTSTLWSTNFYKSCKGFIKNTNMFKTRGSGGTCAQVVFDYANKYIRRWKNRALIIIFTDGYVEERIDFHGFKNRMWVSTGKDFAVENEKPGNVFEIVNM